MSTRSTKSPTASSTFMDVKSPQGLLDKIKMLPMLGRDGQVLPQGCFHRPVQGSHQATTTFRCSIFPSCNAGRRTADASSRCPASSPKTRKPANATSACIACRSTTSSTTGMHWQRQKHGAEHYREQHARRPPRLGEAHPVTAALDMMARSGGGSRVAEGKQAAGQAWKSRSPSAPILP